MVNHNCDLCGFSSNNKKDYNRHIRTKKHIGKVKENTNESKMNPIRIQHESSNIPLKRDVKTNKTFFCSYCDNSYSTQSNRSKHMKKCIKKDVVNKEMENLKKENERIQQQAKEKEKLLKQQAKEEKKIMQKQLETYKHKLKSMTTPQTIN